MRLKNKQQNAEDVLIDVVDDDVPDKARTISNNNNYNNENNEDNNGTIIIADVPLRRFQHITPESQVSPVFIDHENRQFLNPISYIGGPRISPNGRLVGNRQNRNSIDSITSILSIDWFDENLIQEIDVWVNFVHLDVNWLLRIKLKKNNSKV